MCGQVAARDFVLAAGAGVDLLETAVDGEFYCCVVADFEMEESVIFDAAPVLTEKGGFFDQIQRPLHRAQGSMSRQTQCLNDLKEYTVLTQR